MDAILVSGIQNPKREDGEEIVTGQFLRNSRFRNGDGAVPLRTTREARKKLGEVLEEKLGVDNVVWFFGVEKDLSVYPPRKEVYYAPGPGMEEYSGELVFKRWLEFRREEILVPGSIRKDMVFGKVEVEFVGCSSEEDLPLESEWILIYEEDGRHAFSPEALSADKRPAFSLGIKYYTFAVPPGKCRLAKNPGFSAKDFETQVGTVRAGKVLRIRANIYRKAYARVKFTIRDVYGREITAYRLYLVGKGVGGWAPTFAPENRIGELRLKGSSYKVKISAYGYKDAELEFECYGGESKHLSIVLMPKGQ